MSDDDLISHYDYVLPEELIAQTPAARRDASRLLVIDRRRQSISHRLFQDLPDLLEPRDLLVLNDTRVVPARLSGYRTATGGKWEGLFLREETNDCWRIIGKTRGRLEPGETITLSPTVQRSADVTSLTLRLVERLTGGEWLCRADSKEATHELLDRFGTMPLPHYMKRDAAEDDRLRYQTTYAERPGAVAAPTAGLHFTPEIFSRCQERGVKKAHVTLHVGLGTFRPVSVERLDEHEMHAEWCELPEDTVQSIQSTRQEQGRVIAVGTTSVRTLESVARSGPLRPWQGETDLFIRPPWTFQVVDGLLTNFHLPKSTLLVLVSTFAGHDLTVEAYRQAIQMRYRFYSYGDAMLIL